MKIDRFRVAEGGRGFRLKKTATDDTEGVSDEKDAARRLEAARARLEKLQEKLYAQDRWGILLIFQAMDAAGKDGTIKYVMSGVNPQGCQVFSFKSPSVEELDHDFMWRCMRCLPERGRIGIFNRSYYEEVLVVRVHPEFLAAERLPPTCCEGDLWAQRYEDINNIEAYLAHNGILPIKFFLHVSKDEQQARLLKRLDKPTKNWKFSEDDLRERKLWDQYTEAYEEMLRGTSTKQAPWYVIPADHKWYTRVAVAEIIAERMEKLDLHFPEVPDERRKELARLKKKFEAEG
jgi:PPK2 family polyphosphate:nucleotide phosphotransferase